MTDLEIEEVISTLDLMAKDAIKVSKEKLLMNRDAKRMAELIYDIYQDKKMGHSRKDTPWFRAQLYLYDTQWRSNSSRLFWRSATCASLPLQLPSSS